MKEIWKAIIKVMQEVNNINKNTSVWAWNNSYKAVSDVDVKKAIRKSMWDNGLSIMSTWITSKIQIDRWEEEVTWNNNTSMKTKQSVFTEVEAKYLLLHTSWESIELAWYGQWVDSQDKWAGKATTYALKNVLINLFLVPTWDDTDNTHSKDIAVPQKKYDNNEKKKWFNYEDLFIIAESWNTTEKQIADIVKQDWYSLSAPAKIAIRHYVDTWEIDKNLFYKKK